MAESIWTTYPDLFDAMKALAEKGVSSRKAAQTLSEKPEFGRRIVTNNMLLTKARANGVTFQGSNKGGGNNLPKATGAAVTAKPRTITQRKIVSTRHHLSDEDKKSAGVSILDIEDAQCREPLRGEGTSMIYCGKKTKSVREPYCPDHGGARF